MSEEVLIAVVVARDGQWSRDEHGEQVWSVEEGSGEETENLWVGCGEVGASAARARKDEGLPRLPWRAPLDEAPVCVGALVVSAK